MINEEVSFEDLAQLRAERRKAQDLAKRLAPNGNFKIASKGDRAFVDQAKLSKNIGRKMMSGA